MLLKDFISGSVRGLEPLYGREEAKSLVLMLCEACLGTKSYTHIVNPEYSIDISRQAELDAALVRAEQVAEDIEAATSEETVIQWGLDHGMYFGE